MYSARSASKRRGRRDESSSGIRSVRSTRACSRITWSASTASQPPKATAADLGPEGAARERLAAGAEPVVGQAVAPQVEQLTHPDVPGQLVQHQVGQRRTAAGHAADVEHAQPVGGPRDEGDDGARRRQRERAGHPELLEVVAEPLHTVGEAATQPAHPQPGQRRGRAAPPPPGVDVGVAAPAVEGRVGERLLEAEELAQRVERAARLGRRGPRSGPRGRCAAGRRRRGRSRARGASARRAGRSAWCGPDHFRVDRATTTGCRTTTTKRASG